jgi:uncharacterized coiled-coil DUF342 family protein
MGFFKDKLDKLQKSLTEKEEQAKDPAVEKAEKKEQAKKNFDRMNTVMGWAKKGVDQYNKAAKKTGELLDTAAEKTVELVEKAKPVAEKIDEKANEIGGKLKPVADKVTEKADEFNKSQAKKPSTGSGLLDILTPAVPETDATKPKDKKENKGPDTTPAKP